MCCFGERKYNKNKSYPRSGFQCDATMKLKMLY